MLRIIGGKYKRRKLNQPPLEITRPTKDIAKEGLFSSLGDLTNKSFLDLFGGSGAIGLEAISRNAKEVYIIEKDKTAFKIIKENAELISDPNVHLINDDYLKAINKINKVFDIIFIDPPYKMVINKEFIDSLFDNNVADKNTIIIIERDSLLDETISDFDIKVLKYGKSLMYILRSLWWKELQFTQEVLIQLLMDI